MSVIVNNTLYYGDNLDALRNRVRDETVDLCYIDPPFNSKRNYNQIYNNIGGEDRAQAQAFVDTWTWDDHARDGYEEIIGNDKGRYPKQTVALVKGLRDVLQFSPMLAYLVHMARRATEIHRVLKPTGSFYLHCDTTASHYLKIILDGIFCSQGGDFVNEVIWYYGPKATQNASNFQRKHDTILFYSKGEFQFNTLLQQYSEGSLQERDTRYRHQDEDGRYRLTTRRDSDGHKYRAKVYLNDGVAMTDVWSIGVINATSRERLGYPTQKPEALLERIIKASSNEGDVVLDAYCGCGTTVAVAQRLKRQWIGVDITYQSISLILKRLSDTFGTAVSGDVVLSGVPRDIASARALAQKKDDRLRKEFEKWAVLTYTNNRAAVNGKKGADGGIDGTTYFFSEKNKTDKMVFQVKSGHVSRGDIAKLKGDMEREQAAMAALLTLEEPTGPMRSEAKAAGYYTHPFTGMRRDRIQIVTIQEILEQNKRIDLPLSMDVLKAAELALPGFEQTALNLQ